MSTFRESAMLYYTDLPPRVMRRLEAYRVGATCAGCRQRIAPTVELAVRGIHTYHPSCARRADVQAGAQAVRTTAPAVPIIIGRLEGAAVSFDKAGCSVPIRDGGGLEHETFIPGCFDDAIAAGGQLLKLNHEIALRGVYVRIVEDGGALRFRFTLHDGPLERSVLERVTNGSIQRCSIAFNPARTVSRYRGTTIERTRVALTEISLLTSDRKPAWFDTWIRIA